MFLKSLYPQPSEMIYPPPLTWPRIISRFCKIPEGTNSYSLYDWAINTGGEWRSLWQFNRVGSFACLTAGATAESALNFFVAWTALLCRKVAGRGVVFPPRRRQGKTWPHRNGLYFSSLQSSSSPDPNGLSSRMVFIKLPWSVASHLKSVLSFWLVTMGSVQGDQRVHAASAPVALY
jgi:hypothetical protein